MRKIKPFLYSFLSILLVLTACSQVMQPSPTFTPVPTATTLPSPAPTDTPVPTIVPTDTSVPTTAPTVTPTTLPWKLVWSDEFDGKAGTAPDAKKWTYDIGGGGWGNGEHEYYTNSIANAALDGNGSLVITAQKTDATTAANLKCFYGPCEYTSARILTQGLYDFTYGKVEARLKIPAGQGLWPAFWLLGADIDTNGWPKCGELDIMENIGKEPSAVHGTAHGPSLSSGNDIGNGASYMLDKGNFVDDFHIYSIEWETDALRWYVDGNLYYSLTSKQLYGAKWVYDHPFFIILNVAVGGSWPGFPNDTTNFPQTMTVDYVRVYQH